MLTYELLKAICSIQSNLCEKSKITNTEKTTMEWSDVMCMRFKDGKVDMLLCGCACCVKNANSRFHYYVYSGVAAGKDNSYAAWQNKNANCNSELQNLKVFHASFSPAHFYS